MPHQCTKCGQMYPDAAKELLNGCECGSRFFYYIKQERADQLNKDAQQAMVELEKADKVQIEKDIREITGLDDEPEKPVILDLESVRVLKPGKFEIDIVNLFNKKRPLIYKLEEGKYVIDLSSSIKADQREIDKKIRDPKPYLEKEENQEAEEEETEEVGEEKPAEEEEKEEIDTDNSKEQIVEQKNIKAESEESSEDKEEGKSEDSSEKEDKKEEDKNEENKSDS